MLYLIYTSSSAVYTNHVDMKWMPGDEITFSIVHTVVFKMSVIIGIWMNYCSFYRGYFYEFYDLKMAFSS